MESTDKGSADLKSLAEEIEKFAKERDWSQFHSPKNLAMALSVEAAEIVEIFQWLTEGESRNLPPKKVAHLGEELADTLIYLIKIAGRYDIDLLGAAQAKLRMNAEKYPVAKAKGSAKKYDEL